MICKHGILVNEIIGKGLILIVLVFLASCGSTSLTVTGRYPAPLTSQLPFSATLLLGPEFREFVATPSKDLTMGIGTAQTQMITNVLSKRFKSLTVVSTIPEHISTDILITANVAGVQIGTPAETHLSIYEVWIKYNLEIANNSNELIAKWFMPAYGKTPSAFMTSEEKAINTAAQVALRDAGVRLVTDFHRIPEFHYWVVRQQQVKDQAKVQTDEQNESPTPIDTTSSSGSSSDSPSLDPDSTPTSTDEADARENIDA